MVPFQPARSTPVWVGRAGASIAVLSVIVHIAGLGGHSVGHAMIVLAMAATCLVCAWHLWSTPRVRDWALVAVMNVAMIAVHQNMSMPGAHGSHRHGATATSETMTHMSAPTLATALALIEAAFATTVLFAITRSTGAERLSAGPRSSPSDVRISNS